MEFINRILIIVVIITQFKVTQEISLEGGFWGFTGHCIVAVLLGIIFDKLCDQLNKKDDK